MNKGLKSALLSLAFLLATNAKAGSPVAIAAMPQSVSVGTTAEPAPHSGKLHRFHGVVSPRMTVEGINDQGWIVGRWTDSQGIAHWFLLNPFLPAFSDISHHGTAKVEILTARQSS